MILVASIHTNVGEFPLYLVPDCHPSDFVHQCGWYIGDDAGPLSHGPFNTLEEASEIAKKLAMSELLFSSPTGVED